MKSPGLSAYLAVFAVWFAIYIPCLGKIELQGNEARRILPAITMLETGDWITPELADQAYYKKPPLINWLVALSFKLHGDSSETSARLVSAIFTLVLALSFLSIPSGILDSGGRLISALIYLTFFGTIMHGRLIEIEAALASLTGLSVLWWLGIASCGVKGWKLWIPPAFILGLGLLLKGPIILMFYYCTVLCVLVHTKRSMELLSPAHILSIAVMLAIFAVWALKMRSLAPSGETAQVTGTWKSEILDQLKPENFDYGHWGEAIMNALLFFIPWIVFLPLLWNKTAISKIPPEESGFLKGIRLSLVVGFVLVNIMPGTQARYSAPLLPIASIAFGSFLPLCEMPAVGKLWKIILRTLNWILIGLIAVSAILICGGWLDGAMHSIEKIRLKMLFPLESANFASMAVLVIAALAVSALFTMKIRRSSGIPALVAGTAMQCVLAMILCYILVMPLAAVFAKKKHFAEQINKAIPAGVELQILDVGYQPYLYYIRNPRTNIYSFEAIGEKSEYLMMLDSTYADMMKDIGRNPALYGGRKPETVATVKYKRHPYRIIRLR